MLYSTHKGTVRFVVNDENVSREFTLSNVLYIPEWNTANLISWNELSNKCKYVGEGTITTVSLKNGQPIFTAKLNNEGLPQVKATVIYQGSAHLSSVQFWHEALGHASPQTWNTAAERYTDGDLLPKRPSTFICEPCIKANLKYSHPTSLDPPRSSEPFDLIHCDLAGPFSVHSIGGSLYYISFIDDATHFPEIEFLKAKDNAVDVMIAKCELIHTQTGRYPRSFLTDRGTEFVNKRWKAYCKDKGIKHLTTAAYIKESNGTAERFNLTIISMGRTVLNQYNAPKFLWAEAFKWATYIKQRLPHMSLKGKTPYEALHHKSTCDTTLAEREC